MKFIEIVLIAISLSMDAFAVSICKGLSFKKITIKKACLVGLYFGVFQSLMPFLGYFLGISFSTLFDKIDHWIVFVLLTIIGFGMIRNSFNTKANDVKAGINFKEMIVLAIATSIDALAVGVTFAFLKVNLFISLSIIGVVCFFISFFGVFLGYKFGSTHEKKAGLFGGIVLFLIGLKIFLDHLGFF